MNDYHLSNTDLIYQAIHRIRSIAYSALISLALMPSFANAQDPLQQLTLLNQAGASVQAYSLANEMLPQWEGEPAFDLQYGIAAVDSGFFSEGIFALERVIMNEPANDYARLELARAYFAAQEDERARAEFERVLAANPPQEVRENIRPYLDTISARESRRRAVWRGTIDFRTGYDTNINASTDDDLSLLLGLPPGSVTSVAPQEDSYGSFAGSLLYSKPLTSDSDFIFNANGNHRANSSGDLSQTTVGASLGYSKRSGSNTYSVGLMGNHFLLEDQAYRDMLGVNASWRYTASPQTSMTVFASASDLSYKDNPGKDSLFAIGGLSIQHVFAVQFRPSLTLGVSLGMEDASDDEAPGALQNTERDIVGANLSLGLAFTPNLSMTTSLRTQRSEYAEELVLPPVLREDINVGATIKFDWRVADSWYIGLEALAVENDSTAGFTSYSREQLSLTARYLMR